MLIIYIQTTPRELDENKKDARCQKFRHCVSKFMYYLPFSGNDCVEMLDEPNQNESAAQFQFHSYIVLSNCLLSDQKGIL